MAKPQCPLLPGRAPLYYIVGTLYTAMFREPEEKFLPTAKPSLALYLPDHVTPWQSLAEFLLSNALTSHFLMAALDSLVLLLVLQEKRINCVSNINHKVLYEGEGLISNSEVIQ